jgi:hypothetical protein
MFGAVHGLMVVARYGMAAPRTVLVFHWDNRHGHENSAGVKMHFLPDG